ncbi:hypothetical protein B0T18DRAFT_412260 [Schizothecium vesticola]|uniref:Uncharacterized protein n=1 Tax=Schizothecium vesticola TaxID=314040 RepID=A0AA40K5I1_9PEZI|nr:hypothetical protein B0T18DRAFT_412260 [Schizothecium vesticola]
MVQKIKSDLCEDWLHERAERWGPTTIDDTGVPPSWTGTITTKIGSAFHYTTCPGHDLGGKPCVGSWCRKDRGVAAAGLHCTYGGWVTFDGETIAGSQPQDDGAAGSGGKKSLQQLRRRWAEHVLAQQATTGEQKKESHDGGYTLAGMWNWLRLLWAERVLRRPGQQTSTGEQLKASPDRHRQPLAGIWDQAVMDKVHEMLRKAIAQAPNKGTDREKLLGHGSGGWSGVSENGIVLKRDAGSRRIGGCADRCDLEPGGMWQRGDVEVWTVWNGWSCLVSRDGRWRPAYHLEILLCLWMAVVDYGSTRAAYRNRQADWLRATEWLWVNTPPDVPLRVVEVFRSDTMEMIKREKERMRSLQPDVYVADDISTKERRYRCFQDRAGEVIAYHTVGEGLETPRGLVAAWVMIVLNDLIDYERDVLCGETNNFVRGLTSSQQVIDAAAWILKALCWSMDNRDHDLTNAIVGTAALYLVTWRYNAPKMARYKAISIREKRPGTPPEMEDIAEIVRRPHTTTATEADRSAPSYGELFVETKERVRALYSGCTCRTPPEGHDAWQLLAQAMEQGGNDDVEERLHVALVALNNGANAGDVDCECGVDLLLYECFGWFLDPDTGIVARLHYRSGNTGQGNTVTE